MENKLRSFIAPGAFKISTDFQKKKLKDLGFNDDEIENINDIGYLSIIATTLGISQSEFLDMTMPEFNNFLTLKSNIQKRECKKNTIKDILLIILGVGLGLLVSLIS